MLAEFLTGPAGLIGPAVIVATLAPVLAVGCTSVRGLGPPAWPRVGRQVGGTVLVGLVGTVFLALVAAVLPELAHPFGVPTVVLGIAGAGLTAVGYTTRLAATRRVHIRAHRMTIQAVPAVHAEITALAELLRAHRGGRLVRQSAAEALAQLHRGHTLAAASALGALAGVPSPCLDRLHALHTKLEATLRAHAPFAG